METVTQNLSNGNKIEYKIINGTAYHIQTPEQVVKILESARINRTRIKVYLGDADTGQDWCEESDKYIYIGRSTGKIQIPLAIANNRSLGGGGLLDHCIVKITEVGTFRTLYQHPQYKQPEIRIEPSDLPEYQFNTLVNGKVYGRHKSIKSAKMLMNKLS